MKGSLLNGNLLNEGEKSSTGIYKVIFKRSMLYQRPIFTEYLKKKERDKKKCFNNIYTYAFWLKITGTNCTSFLQHLLSLYIYTLPCQYQSDCLDTASNCDVLYRAPWAS